MFGGCLFLNICVWSTFVASPSSAHVLPLPSFFANSPGAHPFLLGDQPLLPQTHVREVHLGLFQDGLAQAHTQISHIGLHGYVQIQASWRAQTTPGRGLANSRFYEKIRKKGNRNRLFCWERLEMKKSSSLGFGSPKVRFIARFVLILIWG